MKTDVENNEWKAEAPYLASLQKENPFRVPEQYFDALPESIANSVYLNELKEEIDVTGFTVPDEYFSSLHSRILAETSESVLNSLPVSDGYNVPDQYFQTLQSKILAKTTALELEVTKLELAETTIKAQPVKSTSKIVRLWHSGLLKYASAACFILVSTFGLYLNQHSFTKESAAIDIANEQMLYDISEQDIIDHVQGNTSDEPKSSIPDTDMENYILNNYSQNDLSSAL